MWAVRQDRNHRTGVIGQPWFLETWSVTPATNADCKKRVKAIVVGRRKRRVISGTVSEVVKGVVPWVDMEFAYGGLVDQTVKLITTRTPLRSEAEKGAPG